MGRSKSSTQGGGKHRKETKEEKRARLQSQEESRQVSRES